MEAKFGRKEVEFGMGVFGFFFLRRSVACLSGDFARHRRVDSTAGWTTRIERAIESSTVAI